MTELSKQYRKAKRLFAKRADEENERKLKEVLKMFKEEEINARNQYLDDLIKMMDQKKPAQFWKIVNRVRKDNSKTVVQPIKREDGSLALTDEEIFKEMKERYGKETLDVKELESQWYIES